MRAGEGPRPGGLGRPGRRRIEQELDEEIRFHLERTQEELEGRGMSPEAARHEAERRFGSVRAHRQAILRLDVGRMRTMRMVETVDAVRGLLGHAARRVVRGPGFAAAVVVTLGLGIGANAVMFGVVDRLMLSPPQGLAEPGGLQHLYVERGVQGEPRVFRWFTHPDFLALQDVEAFEELGAYTVPIDATLGRGDDAEQIRTVRASASLFPALGARTRLGRFFTEEEDAEGAPPRVVLSEEFWVRRFGADPGILGRELDIGPGRYEVIGVASRGFTGAELSPVDAWVPMVTSAHLMGAEGCMASPNCWWLQLVARMRDGAAPSAGDDAATARHLALRETRIAEGNYDGEARVFAASIVAANGPNPSAEASVSRWLAGVSLIVLLIACANVANLLLARSVRLRRELSVRAAIGASRFRLVGEALTETVFLALLGAGVALAAASWGAGIVHDQLLPDVAFDAGALTPRMLGFTAVAVLFTVALAGVVPSIRAARMALNPGRAESFSRSRMRGVLTVAQGALSVVLLVGAGLFVRSLSVASSVDFGFDPEVVAVLEFEWNDQYPGPERAAVYRDALDRLRSLPEVVEGSPTLAIPFWSSYGYGEPRIPGIERYPSHPGGGPYVNKVGSTYLRTMGISLVDGRDFGPADDLEGAAPVTLVSEAMARAIWGGESAIGRCLHIGDSPEDPAPCTEVVGVVADHRRDGLVEAEPHHLYYVNLDHPEIQGPPQALMIRTRGEASAALGAVRQALAGVAPQLRYVKARSLQDLVDPRLRSWRLGATMFSIFGLLALLVAGVGLYSVLAFDVAQRRREIGIRSALGASRERLARVVIGKAAVLGVVGLALGLGIALGLARFVEELLFQTSGREPGVYLLVGATLGAVALLAAAVPGVRAMRVAPAEALRSE